MARRAQKMVRRAFDPVATAIAVLLVLLTPVDAGAQIPYYPYQCPFASGGHDFSGAYETPVLWAPRTGVWTVQSGSPVTFGQFSDLPTPGDFNNDGIDDAAVFRPVSGTENGGAKIDHSAAV